MALVENDKVIETLAPNRTNDSLDIRSYNRVRTHLSLRKDAPPFRRQQTLGKIVSITILGGLHHQCVRV